MLFGASQASMRFAMTDLPASTTRIDPHDRLWVVLDPIPGSSLSDVLWETELRGLLQAVRGGMDLSRSPTLFTGAEEARAEALARLGRLSKPAQ